MHEKRHFLSYQKCRHDAQIMWPYAYYVTLGSRCKRANSSSEDETDTLPERPTVSAISVWACQAGFWKSTGIPWGLWSCTHWSARYTNGHSKKVSSFELYKLNPLSPHCGLIACELMHCYTWGHLWIVTVRGIVNFFVNHTNTQFTEESKMATTDSPDWRHFREKSQDWWRTWDCSLGQPT